MSLKYEPASEPLHISAKYLDGLLEVGDARLLADGVWQPFGRPPVFGV